MRIWRAKVKMTTQLTKTGGEETEEKGGAKRKEELSTGVVQEDEEG